MKKNKLEQQFKVKFSFLSFIIIFTVLIPLDLYRFYLRDNLPIMKAIFNSWGNVFDSVLVGFILTLITTLLISIKFKDKSTLNLSLILSSIFFVALANFFSETGLGQSFLIHNVGSYLKNVGDITDFILPLIVAPPLILQIVKLKVVEPESELEFELNKD
ncbi:MAG: hypothetical protein WAS94_00845 [Candidatus Saccharimonadales bacterium]